MPIYLIRLLRALMLVLPALLLSTRAQALCGGTDLIDALPADQRQSILSAAQAQPFAQGLLWQAEKAGTKITLFGTYHFAHAQTEAHLQSLSPMIRAANKIYLEVSEKDAARLQEELAEDPSIIFYVSGPTLPNLLGDADWERFSKAMQERSIPSVLAAHFKPFWAALMLSFGPCEARNGALEGHGIDERIGQLAETIGTPSQSLEDYKQVLTIFDDLPQSEQLDMIRITLDSPDDPDDLAYTLRQRYLDQDIATIWEYSRWQAAELGMGADFAAFEERLLTARNHNWIKTLMADALGADVFIAVGAAHLPGKDGVLQLLQDQGFTITPLPFPPKPE